MRMPREWGDDYGTVAEVTVRCNGNNCGHEFMTRQITQYGARSLAREECPECGSSDLKIKWGR